MITLHGTLRQSGEMTIKERKVTKLWIEHTVDRQNGPADLKIEELFLEPENAKNLPPSGQPIAVEVRPYPSGKGIALAGVRVCEIAVKKAA
jgi:hypothetical protein